MKTDVEGKKAQNKTKVAFWFDSNLVILLDELRKKFGITRAALIRLVMRELLVTHGLLKQETGSLLPKDGGDS